MKKMLLIFLLISAPASAQILKDTRTPATIYAGQAGRLAGGAYFCNFDAEDVDTFIGLSQAKISTLSRDKPDRIVASLEFSNNYSAWAAKPPEDDCKAFRKTFYKAFAELY